MPGAICTCRAESHVEKRRCAACAIFTADSLAPISQAAAFLADAVMLQVMRWISEGLDRHAGLPTLGDLLMSGA